MSRPNISKGKCSAEDCTWDAFCKGLCRAHYMREWRGASSQLSHRWMPQEIKDYAVARLKAGHPITQVSHEIGYHVTSISIMFKKEVGVGLRQWKKENR